MVGNPDSLLKIVVAVIVTVVLITGACIGMMAAKAAARANINDYLSKGPNDFYPARHDIEGPTKFVIDTIGWNATRVIGNTGIGDSSVAVFDLTSTVDVEYPESGFMCGDVSTQPWRPGSKNVVGNATNESAERVEGNATERAPGNQSFFTQNAKETNVTDNVSRPATGRTAAEAETGIAGTTDRVSTESENLTFAAFHPIQYRNPVRDVLYEHPLATPGTAYCELIGFETPAGALVNVGMKCTGYGY